MRVVGKKARGHGHLHLVESVREGRKVRQRIVQPPGRKDVLAAGGQLERLLRSVARRCERSVALAAMEAGDVACTRIGAPLLFGRLREQTGCAAVLKEQLAGRGFAFDVERAVFVAVLHRLMASGSDRACAHWVEDYAIPGVDGFRSRSRDAIIRSGGSNEGAGRPEAALRHFYRAMVWLGEELPEAEQAHATPFAPRCIKDSLEEALFARGRDLFTCRSTHLI